MPLPLLPTKKAAKKKQGAFFGSSTPFARSKKDLGMLDIPSVGDVYDEKGGAASRASTLLGGQDPFAGQKEKFGSILTQLQNARKKLEDGGAGGDFPSPPESESDGANLQERQANATQNVMYEKEFGSGLGALDAMQDKDYVLGSGSSLNKPARAIGPKSGILRRSARRLRRKGYGAAAQRQALAGEELRVGENNISNKKTRAQDMLGRIEAGKLQRQESEMDDAERLRREQEAMDDRKQKFFR